MGIKLDLSTDATQVENEIKETEARLVQLKTHLKNIKHQESDSLGIKWRVEIRNCLKKDDGSHMLSSHNDIISCIEFKRKIVADRNIKNKVVTSLSLMYKEGFIGRYHYVDGFGIKTYLFGNLDLFSDENRSEIKDDYKHLINEWIKDHNQ